MTGFAARGIGAGTALALALVLAACASGGNAPIRYYVLDPVDGPVLGKAPGPAIAIQALTVPQYLERFRLATRAGQGRLRYSDSHQWSENLRKNLLRTLARNLSQRLATVEVSTPLERSAVPAELRLRVAIQQFERADDGHVVLAATWQIVATGQDDATITRAAELRSKQPVPAGDYALLVESMRQTFGELSGRIAESAQEAAS